MIYLYTHMLIWCAAATEVRRSGLRMVVGGAARVRSHCRFAPPRIQFIQYSLRDLVPLFQKRQCDRPLGATQRVVPATFQVIYLIGWAPSDAQVRAPACLTAATRRRPPTTLMFTYRFLVSSW
jgi:hypothetical protein